MPESKESHARLDSSGARRVGPWGRGDRGGLCRAGDLDLATLAALGHTSPFHFSRLFRAVTGLAPHRYLSRARLERAEQLLTGGDASITAISHQVGFSSVSHFIAAFKRHTGMTPGQYRAMSQTTSDQA